MSTAPVEGERPNGPRSRKGAESRARLVEAAKQIFEEQGFLDARISDIAERAGLSHGSFYHYFDSKEEVFREVAAAVDVRLSAPLHSVMLDPASHATPEERMHEAMRRFFEAYRAEARIMGVIEQVSRYDDEVGRLRQSRQQLYAAQVADSIRELQKRGLADARLKPAVAAAALGSMTSRFAETWLVQGGVKTSLDEAAGQLAVLFLNAMRLPSTSEPAAPQSR